MSFWDYVPVIGPLKDGDWSGVGADLMTGGLYTPVSGAYNAYTGAIDKQRQGLLDAAAQSRAEAERRRQFAMEGLDRAQNFYAPAQQMVTAAYGTPDRLRK